jgi:hypothetical protein
MREGTPVPGEGRIAWGGAVAAVVVAAFAIFVWVYTRAAAWSLAGDNEMLTHPLLVEAFSQLRGGRFPLWTPGRWGGSPLAGDPVAGVLYAPFYLGYALTPPPHWRALDMALCVHLLLLALGTLWLLAALDVRPGVALATAALVALNPTLVFIARGWATYWAAIAYWPWLCGAAVRLARRPALGHGLVAALALAAQVYAGYAQFALYTGSLAALWIVAAPGRARGRRLAVAVLVAALAAALAAPQILPGLDMARESIRAGLRGREMLASLDAVFALAPRAWLDILGPSAVSPGSPYRLALGTVLLGLVGAAGRGFTPRFLALVLLLTAVLASGPSALLAVLRAVPPFGFFGGPVKYFYVSIFVLTVLAGIGLERSCRASAGWRRLIAAGVALAGLPAAAAVLPAAALLAGVVLAGLAIVVGGARPAVLLALAVAQAAGAVAASAVLGASPHLPAGPFAALLRDPLPAAAAADQRRWLALTGEDRLRQVGLNYGSLWGVEAFNGVGPLAQWRQLAVMEDAEPGQVVNLAREVGAGHVVVAGGTSLEARLREAGFAAAPLSGNLRVFDPVEVAPRYQLAPRVRAATAAEAIAAAQRGTAMHDVVLVESESLPGGAEGDAGGSLEVLGRVRGAAALRATVARPTWLVAREPYYRNWRATVDGQTERVYPVGGFFLGILVQAGTHTVTFVYREPGFGTGVVIALCAGPVLASLLARVARGVPTASG